MMSNKVEIVRDSDGFVVKGYDGSDGVVVDSFDTLYEALDFVQELWED